MTLSLFGAMRNLSFLQNQRDLLEVVHLLRLLRAQGQSIALQR